MTTGEFIGRVDSIVLNLKNAILELDIAKELVAHNMNEVHDQNKMWWAHLAHLEDNINDSENKLKNFIRRWEILKKNTRK